MTEQKAKQILSQLTAGFPGIEIPESTIILWTGCLLPLNFESAREAVSDYLFSPGKKYFPTPGEILENYDRIESRRREALRKEEKEDDIATYRKLFSDPIDYHEDYKKMSVQLIRDVWAGTVKFNSPEWKQRFTEIYGNSNNQNPRTNT